MCHEAGFTFLYEWLVLFMHGIFQKRCKKGILRFWRFQTTNTLSLFKTNIVYLVCLDAAQSSLNASTIQFYCVMRVSTKKEKLKRNLIVCVPTIIVFKHQWLEPFIVYIISYK